MQVIRLQTEHQQQYSKFVAAHKSGSFLQSWTWGDFQTSQGKTAIRYGVFDDQGLLIAAVQLLLTKIPRLPGTYLYAPYGPLLSESADTAVVIPELLAKLKSDFSQSWFIRFEPKDDLPIDGKPTIHIQPGSSLITDLTDSEETLLGAMHQKTRYNIKVATKHGVVISTATDAKLNQQAIDLLVATSNRQGYKSYSASYYQQLLDFFNSVQPGDCTAILYKAIYQGRCIASAIMIDHGTTRTYLFGGSDNSQRNLMAPYALHWQAISDAKAISKSGYDWWGTETASGTTPGFVQFKLRWGGTQRFYAGARDVVLSGIRYQAYTALRKVNRLI